MPAQELAKPRTSKYITQFGGTGTATFTPFTRLKMAIIGSNGTGKTSVLEGWERLLRLDFDMVGSSRPDAKCLTIPDPNSPTAWSWTRLIEIQKALVADAEAGKREFDFIAFDTYDRFLDLAMAAVAAKYGVPSFTDLDTRTSYGALYQWITEYTMPLEQAGYGLIFICVSRETTVEDIDGSGKKFSRSITELAVPAGAWNRIRNLVHMFVYPQTRGKFIPAYKTEVGKDGKERQVMDPKGAKTVSQHILSFTPPPTLREAQVRKLKADLPDVVEAQDGQTLMEALEVAYNKAIG